MTRVERLAELSLLLQELEAEARIEAWLTRNQMEVSSVYIGGERPWCCDVGTGIAIGRGATERDARAHAFSIIFSNEAGGAQ